MKRVKIKKITALTLIHASILSLNFFSYCKAASHTHDAIIHASPKPHGAHHHNSHRKHRKRHKKGFDVVLSTCLKALEEVITEFFQKKILNEKAPELLKQLSGWMDKRSTRSLPFESIPDTGEDKNIDSVLPFFSMMRFHVESYEALLQSGLYPLIEKFEHCLNDAEKTAYLSTITEDQQKTNAFIEECTMLVATVTADGQHEKSETETKPFPEAVITRTP